jgi:hypothetical protein
MDEPKHPMGGKPDVVSLCPFCIGTVIRYIGSKHYSEIGHLPTAFALGKTFGIDSTLFCLRIEKLTPGVQIDYQQTPVHHLLVTTETTFGAFTLPVEGVTVATHGESLQRAVSACSEHLAVWEEEWREL